MEEGNLEDLLIEEVKVVFKYLIKIGATKEDAEDIVQETLYKTLNNIDSVNHNKIRSWLFKVSINSYYSLYNKKQRQSNISLDDIENLMFITTSTEEQVLAIEKADGVRSALDQLKPSYRDLLVLKYLLGLSYKEIADTLDLPETQIKTYLYRARNKFRDIWEELHCEKVSRN